MVLQSYIRFVHVLRTTVWLLTMVMLDVIARSWPRVHIRAHAHGPIMVIIMSVIDSRPLILF